MLSIVRIRLRTIKSNLTAQKLFRFLLTFRTSTSHYAIVSFDCYLAFQEQNTSLSTTLLMSPNFDQKARKVEPLSLLAQILHFWSILATFRLNLSCSNQIEELFFSLRHFMRTLFPFSPFEGKIFQFIVIFVLLIFPREREKKTQR